MRAVLEIINEMFYLLLVAFIILFYVLFFLTCMKLPFFRQRKGIPFGLLEKTGKLKKINKSFKKAGGRQRSLQPAAMLFL